MTRLSQLSRSVAGQVVLVTGAASGMGRAEALLFADEGARVAVTDLDAERVDPVVAQITGAGGVAHGWVLDVADPAAIESVVAEIADRWGTIDVLVNNAGVALGRPIDAADYDEIWYRSLDVMLTAHERLTRACLPHLLHGGGGRIVNIASTEGLAATPGNSAYVTAKHGVVGFTKAMAVELGPLGVTVNCVCPGPIHTGMTEAIPVDAKAKFARRRVPIARYGDPEEVAHMVLNLALPASSYVNGAIIPVDGGMTVKAN